MPIKIKGTTSGSTTITAPDTGSDETIELSSALASKLDLAGGKILQVVQGSHATEVTVASTSYTDTGLSVTITPSSATNKILIVVSQNMGVSRASVGANASLQILRNSTSIIEYANCIRLNGALGYASLTEFYGSLSFTYLDSPTTTSAITYKTQGKSATTTSSAAAIYQYSDSPSYITVMEVSS